MKIKVTSPLQLATHFKSLRRAKGWSQEELGRRLGITQSRVAQIESNPAAISVDKLIQIIHLLDAGLFLELERGAQDSQLASDKTAGGKSKTQISSKANRPSYRDSSTGRFVEKKSSVKNPKMTKW